MRSAALALTLAALGVTGCGGSAEAPPPAAAPPVPQTATASMQGSGGGIGVDIGEQEAAVERSLRTWGREATRACRKSQRRLKPWNERISSIARGKPTRAKLKRLGRTVADTAKAAEYEYDLLRAIVLPAESDAVHEIYTFLEMEEEALRLVQRVGAEITALDDLESLVFALKRFKTLEDDYGRAAKAVHAGACTAS
jgi:hypothetical protein